MPILSRAMPRKVLPDVATITVLLYGSMGGWNFSAKWQGNSNKQTEKKPHDDMKVRV